MKNKMIKTMTLLAASALTLGATAPVFAAEATEEVAVVDETTEETTDETAEEANEEVADDTAEVSPVVGLWEGVSKDVSVSFEFKEDGTYVAKFADAKVAEGAWVLEEDVITLDTETPDEMTLEFDEASESMKAVFGDEECVFAKGEVTEDEEEVVMTMKAFMDKVLAADVADDTEEDADVAEEDVTEETTEENVTEEATEEATDDAAETEATEEATEE